MYFSTFILKNLTRRPTRTVLTILGLSVAVGSMIALMGISDNFREAMRETFEKRGVDLIITKAGALDQLSSEIDESIVDRVRAMPEVEAVDAAIIDLTEMTRREPRDDVAVARGAGLHAARSSRQDEHALRASRQEGAARHLGLMVRLPR